ncbi:MAG: IclR family transcriptional regulator domain-containing protein, partial [Bosea sp. (in: a-proteobacteria)]
MSLTSATSAGQSQVAERDLMAGLEKGLAVIACFDGAHQQLTIAEVSAMTGLSRAAARRCLLTLTASHYATYDGKFFRLTARVLRLGYAYLASSPLPQILQPFLEQLSEETHESASASILEGHEIIYIARSAQKRIMSVGLSIGARLPAYCTSMGRMLLSALPAEEARQRVLAARPVPLTGHTLTETGAVMARVHQAAAQGWALVDQELEIGLISIA